MRKSVKVFIIYFPVVLVSLQILVNLFALINRDAYNAVGFYLNTFLGTNILFSFFLLAFTFSFRFCTVSRWSAIAEVLFGLNYLIVQQDNLYNIIFHIIVGTISLWLTYKHFTTKFPLCRISLLHKFFSYTILTGSCAKGLDIWEQDVKATILGKHLIKSHDRNSKNYI